MQHQLLQSFIYHHDSCLDEPSLKCWFILKFRKKWPEVDRGSPRTSQQVTKPRPNLFGDTGSPFDGTNCRFWDDICHRDRSLNTWGPNRNTCFESNRRDSVLYAFKELSRICSDCWSVPCFVLLLKHILFGHFQSISSISGFPYLRIASSVATPRWPDEMSLVRAQTMTSHVLTQWYTTGRFIEHWINVVWHATV